MRYGVTLVLLGLLAGCGGSTGPAGTGRLTLQLVGTSLPSPGPQLASGADVLTITGVQVVARKIRLETADGSCPADEPAAGPTSAASDGEGEEHDDCPDVRLDPTLLEPPIDAEVAATFTVDLPEGSYHEMKLQIHPPSNANEDAAFLADHPGFEGVSVRVTGTFNGADFVFESALTAVVEIELDTAVEVDAETPTAVTLAVDLASWFVDQGGGLLNPIDPTQQSRSQIEQNIRASFHAFGDHDGDGHAD